MSFTKNVNIYISKIRHLFYASYIYMNDRNVYV